MRTAWKGQLRIAGVSALVKAYAANRSTTINFVTVHAGCPSKTGVVKLDYRKHCPACGEQNVPKEDIGKAYDHGVGQLIPVSADEIESCKVVEPPGVTITQFVAKGFLSPRYAERSYFLEPEDGHTETIYTIAEALGEKLVGLGECVLQGRVRPVMVEANGSTVVVHILNDAKAMRAPGDFNSKASKADRRHVTLMRKLAKSMTITDIDEFQPRADPYRENLEAVISGKRAAVVSVQPTAAPKSDNLSAMLTASLEQA